jgi:uncharacterized protein YbjT (DUF2867 family)
VIAAVAGGTGLVGRVVVELLLADDAVERVIAPTRLPLREHPKLDNPRLAGAAWGLPARVDEAYGCLGTTRADAGSAQAFHAVDFDLAVGFARAARSAGARRFGLVSSMGADSGSPFLYPRTKGECEEAHEELGFERLVVARPSLLLGKRARSRAGERIAAALFGAFDFALRGRLAKYRPIAGETVARALVSAVRRGGAGAVVLESDALRSI